MGERITGLVKWFNDAKGFGFIENGKGDVFVHYSVIDSPGFKTLKDGEEVEYEMEQGDKGLHAKKVIRVNQPAEEAAQDAQAKGSTKKGLSGEIEVTTVKEGEIPTPPTTYGEDEESTSKDILSH